MAGGKDIPDWGGTYTEGNFAPLFDHGELAARLGSPVTFDRRGAVVWLYNFEYGLVPVVTSSTNVALVGLSTDRSHYGPFAAYLEVADNALDTATLHKSLSLPNTERVGFSACVNIITNFCTIQFDLVIVVGGSQYTGRIIIDLGDNAGTISVSEAGGDTELDGNYYAGSAFAPYQFVKLVVNTSTKMYERLIVDNVEYDLTSYSLIELASTDGRLMAGRIKLLSGEVQTAFIYVDSMIFTAAEPINT